VGGDIIALAKCNQFVGMVGILCQYLWRWSKVSRKLHTRHQWQQLHTRLPMAQVRMEWLSSHSWHQGVDESSLPDSDGNYKKKWWWRLDWRKLSMSMGN